MRVGLIGPADRGELTRLAIRLEERDGEAVRLDPRADPRVELGAGTEAACGVDLAGVRAFYVADLGLPAVTVRRADGSVDRAASGAALARSQRHLAAWTRLLERLAARARVVNPPATHELHGLKPWECFAYAAADLPVPETVSTSDPARLLALDRDRAWIRKGLVGGYGYTERYEPPADLEAARRDLAGGPLLVQEEIPGRALRAFVLEGRVLGAAEIVSSDGGEVDSRRGDARLERCELPGAIADVCVRATERWRLAFSAVDLVHDPVAGRWGLLECNSAPFFVNFERLTGIDVSSHLANHLLERKKAPLR